MSGYAVYLAFDTETTGLDNTGRAEILSFAGFLLDEDLNTLSELTVYSHPDRMDDASPEALEVNGYSPDLWDARGAVTQQEMMARILDFLGPAKRLLPLGHNTAFDVGMLKSLFKTFGREKDFKNLFQVSEVDTFSFALALDLVTFGRKQGSYKLTELCSRFKIPLLEAHDARHDVLASLELLKYVVNTFRTAMTGNPVEVPKGEMVRPPQQESRLLKKGDDGVWVFDVGKHSGMLLSEVPGDYCRHILKKPQGLSEEQTAALQARSAADPDDPNKPQESRFLVLDGNRWKVALGQRQGQYLDDLDRGFARWTLSHIEGLSDRQKAACNERLSR